MDSIDSLLEANRAYASGWTAPDLGSRPSRRLAVVTCMDVRIDPLAVLGLQLGEAHVIRNGGGRLTEDVLRSVALSSHALGVDTVVLMQHTACGLTGVTDEELRRLTGADLDFLTIGDHARSLRSDIESLVAKPYLTPITTFAGLLYDVETALTEEVVRWQRAG